MTYIGIVGAGTVSGKNCVALLDDYISAVPLDYTFVFAVDPESWHESHDEIYDWVAEKEWPYIAVFNQEAAGDKDLKFIIDRAKEAVKVTRVSRKVADVVNENRGVLALLWDENNEHPGDPAYDALVVADERGIKAYDLSDGWERISFSEVLEDETEEEDTSPEPDTSPDDEVLEEEPPKPPTFPESILHHPPSQAELEAMKRPDLKRLAVHEGLDLPERAHTATIVEALINHFAHKMGEVEEAPAETHQNDVSGPEEISVTTDTDEVAIFQETEAEAVGGEIPWWQAAADHQMTLEERLTEIERKLDTLLASATTHQDESPRRSRS